VSDLYADPFPPASLDPDEVPEGMETILNPIGEGVQQFLEPPVAAPPVVPVGPINEPPEDAECWNCGNDEDLSLNDNDEWECNDCHCSHEEVTHFLIEWSANSFDCIEGSYEDECDADQADVVKRAIRALRDRYPYDWEWVNKYG